MDSLILEKLDSLLRLEMDIMGKLRDILEEESHALLSRDPSALEAVSTAKNRQLQELFRLENEREELFIALKLGENPADRLGELDHQHPRGGLQHAWHRLLSLGEECRTLNRLNGATIELSHLHVRQALQAINGAPEVPYAYDAGGRRQEDLPGRRLGQA
ncbi:flagella synthesis protein FlgN [Thiolapillus sp.]